jgi:uncharacterized protein
MVLNLVVFFLVISYIALGIPVVQRCYMYLKPIRTLTIGFQLCFGLLLYICIAGFGSGMTIRQVAILLTYSIIPVGLQCMAIRKSNLGLLADIATVIVIWLPMELGFLPATTISGVPFSMLIALLVLLVTFLFFQRVRNSAIELGFVFSWTWKEVWTVFAVLPIFFCLSIPLGLHLGFLVYRAGVQFMSVPGLILLQYFFIALPEELLFRGVIQQLLERYTNELTGLLCGSTIFALAHINNVTAYHGVPNLPYVLMALVAGLAYGFIFQRTRKVTVSALAHMLVNLVWILLFRG